MEDNKGGEGGLRLQESDYVIVECSLNAKLVGTSPFSEISRGQISELRGGGTPV